MTGESQRAQAVRRDQIAGPQHERPVKSPACLRVVGRVACLTCPLLVREAQKRVGVGVPRICAQHGLQTFDLLGRGAHRKGSRADVISRGGNIRCRRAGG